MCDVALGLFLLSGHVGLQELASDKRKRGPVSMERASSYKPEIDLGCWEDGGGTEGGRRLAGAREQGSRL